MRLILMRSNVSILSHCIPLYPTRDKRDVSHRGSRLKTMNQMVFLAIYIYGHRNRLLADDWKRRSPFTCRTSLLIETSLSFLNRNRVIVEPLYTNLHA